MDKKKIPYHKGPAKLNLGKTKCLTQKSKRLKRVSDNKDSGWIETKGVIEDSGGNKYKKRRVQSSNYGGTYDYKEHRRMERRVFDGRKGDDPTSCFSKEFKENYNKIKGFEEKELTSNGVPKPKKFKKSYG